MGHVEPPTQTSSEEEFSKANLHSRRTDVVARIVRFVFRAR
jgi:hypothetical protein